MERENLHCAARSAAAGSAIPASWLAVGKSSVMSNTPSGRIATTEGLARSGARSAPSGRHRRNRPAG